MKRGAVCRVFWVAGTEGCIGCQANEVEDVFWPETKFQVVGPLFVRGYVYVITESIGEQFVYRWWIAGCVNSYPPSAFPVLV